MPARDSKSGYFLSFEGGEGTGKSSQVARLEQRLQQAGCSTLATREPGGTDIGAKIRDILLHESEESRRLSPMSEALLFGLDRFEHLERVIQPALQQGKWVLCDRFADSTLAYQGYALKGGIEKIKTLNQLVVGEGWPDLTFIFDMPVETALERMQARNSEASHYDKKNKEFHENIRNAFLQIAKDESERCVVVNAQASIEEVATRIEAICQERLGVVFP